MYRQSKDDRRGSERKRHQVEDGNTKLIRLFSCPGCVLVFRYLLMLLSARLPRSRASMARFEGYARFSLRLLSKVRVLTSDAGVPFLTKPVFLIPQLESNSPPFREDIVTPKVRKINLVQHGYLLCAAISRRSACKRKVAEMFS